MALNTIELIRVEDVVNAYTTEVHNLRKVVVSEIVNMTILGQCSLQPQDLFSADAIVKSVNASSIVLRYSR